MDCQFLTLPKRDLVEDVAWEGLGPKYHVTGWAHIRKGITIKGLEA